MLSPTPLTSLALLSPDLRRRDPERPQPPLDLPLGGLDLPLLRLNPPPPLDLLAVLAGQVMASGWPLVLRYRVLHQLDDITPVLFPLDQVVPAGLCVPLPLPLRLRLGRGGGGVLLPRRRFRRPGGPVEVGLRRFFGAVCRRHPGRVGLVSGSSDGGGFEYFFSIKKNLWQDFWNVFGRIFEMYFLIYF